MIRTARIPNEHFRSHFGREHEFHVRRAGLIGPSPLIRVGGIGFRLRSAWPMGWVDADPLYIDYTGGGYFLCNRMYPRVRVPVNVAECDTCQQEPVEAAQCSQCANAPDENTAAVPPTITRGMVAGQVVAVLGTPKDVIDMGFRKIFLYDNLRVTFAGGRVIDAR